ncbi:hypothetical protein TRFO_42703 [Tritrichomonas foetus]|uniref:Chromo domain-containing protein n=1 Tax=Tritrichomonas foetus TaxID=1144522 RepID=A0A1J4KZL6_9EUKA|nr:hypothetical protein TRFO_42703 [Tritrichomonas foetus]|eukprot:OHT15132.1 hypothetical protein TRFO_42703 [Tritrichomonas foetus]
MTVETNEEVTPYHHPDEFEKVIGHKMPKGKGRYIKYLVKWKNYSVLDSTFELASRIPQSAIVDYWTNLQVQNYANWTPSLRRKKVNSIFALSSKTIEKLVNKALEEGDTTPLNKLNPSNCLINEVKKIHNFSAFWEKFKIGKGCILDYDEDEILNTKNIDSINFNGEEENEDEQIQSIIPNTNEPSILPHAEIPNNPDNSENEYEFTNAVDFLPNNDEKESIQKKNNEKMILIEKVNEIRENLFKYDVPPFPIPKEFPKVDFNLINNNNIQIPNQKQQPIILYGTKEENENALSIFTDSDTELSYYIPEAGQNFSIHSEICANIHPFRVSNSIKKIDRSTNPHIPSTSSSQLPSLSLDSQYQNHSMVTVTQAISSIEPNTDVDKLKKKSYTNFNICMGDHLNIVNPPLILYKEIPTTNITSPPFHAPVPPQNESRTNNKYNFELDDQKGDIIGKKVKNIRYHTMKTNIMKKCVMNLLESNEYVPSKANYSQESSYVEPKINYYANAQVSKF